ncbi:hypothetical protein EON79_06790 [bacterium]|nr:MAG: hypothetical protein EON79_06790 [bacterium]
MTGETPRTQEAPNAKKFEKEGFTNGEERTIMRPQTQRPPTSRPLTIFTLPCFSFFSFCARSASAYRGTMHRPLPFARHVAVSLSALAAAAAFGQAPAGVADKEAFNRNLQSQVAIIYREKANRTPAMRKMSSDLILAVRMAKGQNVTVGLPKLEVPAIVMKDGTVDVEFHGAVTANLLGQLRSVGAQIQSAYPRFQSISARIPIRSLETAVNFPGIKWVDTVGPAVTEGGNYQTEGDRSMRANELRDNYGLTGKGSKVGVISDSNDYQTASQASGDLPATIDVPNDNHGRPASGEGTAMMEIVYDVAPGAGLAFNNTGGTEASFAQHYLDLFNAGCKIVVDDISYYGEPAFQDGPIGVAMSQIFQDGGICFSAAANSGSLRSNTSSVWEGDFTASGTVFNYGDGTSAPCNAWATGAAANRISAVGRNYLSLQWNDPWGAATNDYDLFVTDANGNVILYGNANNIGGAPIEALTNAVPNQFAYVARYSGVNRVVRLNQNRGRLQYATTGQTYGHAASSNGYGIAAINAALSPIRPFNSGDNTANYSSDGPRRHYYNADGGLIATNLTLAGAKRLPRPALTGPDGGSTNTPGFRPFFGTSAAAPHVAALTALLQEFDPNASMLRLLFALEAGAIDIGTAGFDVNAGSGAVNGLGSVKFLQQTAGASVKPTSVTVSPTSATILTLDLGLKAPPSGINVAVTATGDAGRFTYPSSFVINEGLKTRAFFVGGGGPGYGAASATLTFRDKFSGAVFGSRVINRIASERVSDISLAYDGIKGGKQVLGEVELDKTSLSSVQLELQSSNPAVASVPPTVTVSTNGTKKTFYVTTYPTATDKDVTIRVRRPGVESTWHETGLTVFAPKIVSFATRTTSIYPGNSAVIIGKLDGPAPSRFSVPLSSANSRLLSVPAAVGFSTGSTSASFRALAGPSSTARSVAIIAKSGGYESARITINLLVPQVSSLTLSPNRVVGGARVLGTVKLANNARPGGALVNLSGYASGYATGPATILIPEGSNTGTFTIVTNVNRVAKRLSIRAKTSTESKYATLIVDRL